MLTRSHLLSLLVLAAVAVQSSGCMCLAERRAARFERRAARRSMALYQENQILSQSLGEAQNTIAAGEAHRQQLGQEITGLQTALGEVHGNLEVAEKRIDNLVAERDTLHDKYRDLLVKTDETGSPLPASSTAKFEALARKYPQFEFDPATGVSKFGADLLFSSGSDAVKKQARGLLAEFAAIMNERDAKPFNILVVGHTDDEAIRHPVLRGRHATNWELSSHRATQVVRALASSGVQEHRMGAAGYSKYQPVVANTDDAARQQNRRVEIYVLAPDATVAGFDPNVPR